MYQLALSINDICQLTGIGRTKIYQAIGSGELKAHKFGKRTLVNRSDLEEFLFNLKRYPTKND